MISEMGADLESGSWYDRGRQIHHPLPYALAEPERAIGRPRRILWRCGRQAEQNHGAVAQEARYHAAAGNRLSIDQGVKVFQ